MKRKITILTYFDNFISFKDYNKGKEESELIIKTNKQTNKNKMTGCTRVL